MAQPAARDLDEQFAFFRRIELDFLDLDGTLCRVGTRRAGLAQDGGFHLHGRFLSSAFRYRYPMTAPRATAGSPGRA